MKFIVTITIIIVVFLVSGFFRRTESNNEKIKKYYLLQLDSVRRELTSLRELIQKKSDKNILRKKFKAVRHYYKKMAVITDYFNPFETKLLNGANLPRAEDDNPQVIISPEGFQVLEELLFNPDKNADYRSIASEVNQILNICSVLKNEADLVFKFKDAVVFDALRSSVLRIITLGISGFDSPVAQNSIPEAIATLDGIELILKIYQDEFKKNAKPAQTLLNKKIVLARQFLKTNPDFIKFDRLLFIKEYANPVYSAIIKAAEELNFTMPEERRPVNIKAKNIFEKDAFDITFYSPNERYRPTPERIQLGRTLFYDSILSGPKKRSCATCHRPEIAFTDGLKKAFSMDEKNFLLRNTPTLWNSSLQTKQFFDSRATKLENQLSDVVHNEEEMRGSLKSSVEELKNHPVYAGLFAKAYAADKEPVTEYNIANAISSFVRSLISLNSRFDQYMRGNETKMNVQEKKGFNLFMGKAKCATCHFLPLFNGLVPPEFTETESEILGIPSTKDSLQPVLDKDKGKINFTGSTVHEFAFKTPSVRNIVLTAPYMHNGVFDTLEEVMDFYNKGGGSGLKIAPANQTLPQDKLNLSKKEISDIIAFMKTLTDTVSRSYQ